MSWLGLYGVDLRARIMLPRHAPQGITLKHHHAFGVLDLWGEVAKLPPIRWSADLVRATGACGFHPRRVARQVALRVGREWVKVAATRSHSLSSVLPFLLEWRCVRVWSQTVVR